MKLQKSLSFIAAFLIAITSANEFVENHGHFSSHLYTSLVAQNAGKSVAVSPLSLQACFGMLYMGMRGPAAAELEKGFHFGSSDKRSVGETFKNVLQKYANNAAIEVVNAVYVDSHIQVLPEFENLVKDNFYSDVGKIDLWKGEESATAVNNWVKENTHGKIEKLVEASDFNPDTRLIVLNALYFKGSWKYPFDKESTEKQPFWVSQSESVQVDTMNVVSTFRIKKLSSPKVTIVELPYAGSDMSMLLLVPREREGLAAVESKLQEINLQEVAGQLSERQITLFLPKFKVETEVDLKKFLPSLGVEKMFNSDADFNDLAKSDAPLSISKAVHKVIVEVNEEGTEAAASTGVVGGVRSGPLPVVVDRPFLFVIRDSAGNNAFMGRVLLGK